MIEPANLSDIELQACSARYLAEIEYTQRRWRAQEIEAVAARRKADEALELLNALGRLYRDLQTEYRAIQAENGKRGAFVVIGPGGNDPCST